jgi:hypothetical protein
MRTSTETSVSDTRIILMLMEVDGMATFTELTSAVR